MTHTPRFASVDDDEIERVEQAYRRRDAEQKLRAAEANLTRLDEIIGDIGVVAVPQQHHVDSLDRILDAVDRSLAY